MLIDFHVHVFNPKVAKRAVWQLEEQYKIKPYTYGLVEETLEMFDKWGVDVGVALPIATKPTQQTIINDWMKQQDCKRIVSFGSVHPNAEDVLNELQRIKELGLHGLKFHPDFQDFYVNDKRMDTIYKEITNLELPAVFHSGFDYASPNLSHCTPNLAREVVDKNPKMKLVFAHLGGNEQWEQVYDCLAGCDGEVYFDTGYSFRCENSLMEKIINKHGSERILFASDCPWESAERMYKKIDSLKISDDAKDNIYYKNAERLLGINSK